ncbi:hypothetical protein PV516_18890 [Streptomyces scabiei]|uniref:hypothetical protein n=1 Tax=Streptomyces scabiei TaxID=1930 RepID=UPI0029BF1661|nr:hypothetical protein [Streptomyces scabiei]MDX3165854.1 hypothetical protein [Streptomyces scabiei]
MAVPITRIDSRNRHAAHETATPWPQRRVLRAISAAEEQPRSEPHHATGSPTLDCAQAGQHLADVPDMGDLIARMRNTTPAAAPIFDPPDEQTDHQTRSGLARTIHSLL